MSGLTGSFAFGNNDRTVETVGATDHPLPPHHAAADDDDDDAITDHDADLHLRRSQSRRSATLVAPGSLPTDDDEKDASTTDEEAHRRNEQVHALARRFTNSSATADGASPFHADEESPLNPNGPNFSARAWAKAMAQVAEADDHTIARSAGFCFQNLNVHGFGKATDFQVTVGNAALQSVQTIRDLMGVGKRKIDILRQFDGVVQPGEMLVVLGPPGSGCSTLLKTIAGETHGLYVDQDSYMNYQGISAKKMHSNFRGEAIYTAEVDVHFPMLSVGDTLTFAAKARAPRHPPAGITHLQLSEHRRDVVMAMFGIAHTVNTRVGNDYVRGVSGGERKRVTIAEAGLSGAPLQCWDNSTRGLDSANAIEFCRTLRISSEMFNTTACVAIYQSPQSAYDFFDKVVVLYEGHQIFFGKTTEARAYFQRIGFEPRPRQTDPDFLTSMTSPAERVVKPGFEGRAPRTPEEFAECWKKSAEYAALQREIEAFKTAHPLGGQDVETFKASRRIQQAKGARAASPYTLSYVQQVELCLWRGFQRLKGDPSLTFTQLFGNFLMALVIGSVFYDLGDNTNSFYQRGALLFFAILMNAFGSALEILTLYAQRPIVEKHSRYAFYHPSAEAVASMLTDMPYKVMNAFTFNLALYFMTNLRREPGPFFFFVFVSFLTTLVMSMLFRFIASVSRTLSQAMAPAAILILALIIYTGFTIPTGYMLGWSRWINYLDPISYSFEALMINEFHNRNFTCSAYVPTGGFYNNVGPDNHICSTTGSQLGVPTVSGNDYITTTFEYDASHKWRNIGILFVFLVGLMFAYLGAAEVVSAKKSKGEVLLFRRGYTPAALKEQPVDAENGEARAIPTEKNSSEVVSQVIQKQTSVFHWKDVCYDIKIKSEERRILDHVDGWVKPGTLTALMGVSGAGKTTLLDVLATRVTMGVISGEMLVDGRQRDASFQRKTGYVQQQDLHLATTTVREALNFSALLRQPAHIPRAEKLAYVDEVIKILEMEDYAEAVVGVPGEGLNVEQRKRLTIGVELAAKPQLLLFLDEPTSGLDSQTSWIICDLMEKLTHSGQAILCTIHQPSALLFQRFDRLLFLAKGGKTVYFGEVGESSKTLIDYFERNGGMACPPGANPAEWMLEVIGAAPGSHTDIDWFETWRNSPEYSAVHEELERLKEERPLVHVPSAGTPQEAKASFREFAAPFHQQLFEVTMRVFQQYYRTPSYIYSKTALCMFSGLFIGFSFFMAKNSLQGLQNQMFSIFMMLTIFGQLVQQIMPHFVTQRALYEVRERPSKVYSWQVFMLSNIIVEIPWNTLCAVLLYFTWYYPVGLYRNAEPTDAVHLRGAQMFLLIWTFLIFTCTFTDMVIAAIDTAEAGGNIANLLFSLCLVFCGVLASSTALPGFWIFMYRISPFSYLVSAMLSTAVANTDVVCATNEFLKFQPLAGQTCDEYMAQYIHDFGGYLQNPNATDTCSFCTISDTNTYLAAVGSHYSEVWRNFGLMWVYIVFNVAAALFFYWLARVPKGKKEKEEKK